jgi:hypothetical protein
LPLLRIFRRLIVDIEIHFINTGLLPGAWLGAPCFRTQLDLAEFPHGETAPNPALRRCQRPPAAAPPADLIDQHMELACLPTQYMRTKQTGQAIIDCRYWLPAGGRTAEEFISLVHGSPIGRLWSHLLLKDNCAIRKVMIQQDLPTLFMTQ